MHSNQAVRHKKNKHGRKGVRQPPKPTPDALDAQFSAGYKAGVGAGGQWALDNALSVVERARTIGGARKAVAELVEKHRS